MKKTMLLIFCALILSVGGTIFFSESVQAELFQSIGACQNNCKGNGGHCESTTANVGGEIATVYECVSSPTSSNSSSSENYSTCTKAKANNACSGKTGSAYTECIEAFIDLYCKDGTSIESLSSGNNASSSNSSSFPLENGNSSATNNPNATVPQTNNNSNYSLPSLRGSQATVSSGECESGYSKSAGVCIPDNTGLSGQSVQQILSNLLFWLLAIFATIAVIAFLISGIQYLIASGNEKMAETAKRNMTYSIIGILIGLSGLIVLKAISALLNANIMI